MLAQRILAAPKVCALVALVVVGAGALGIVGARIEPAGASLPPAQPPAKHPLEPIFSAASNGSGGSVSCGQVRTGDVSAEGEEDKFTFDAQAGDTVAITLVETAQVDPSFAPAFSLFDPNGDPVAVGFADQWEFTLALTGPYAISVYDWNHVSRGSYAVGLECLQPPDPNAVHLECGEVVAGDIDAAAEADVFTVDGQAGDTVVISLAETAQVDANFAPRLSIFDPDGDRVAVGVADQWEFTLALTGSYVIKVYDWAHVSRGSYEVTVKSINGKCNPAPQSDVNCDGQVDVIDALFILQYEVGLRVDSGSCPLPPDTLYAAGGDVDSNGLTNVVDALFILQCEVGLKPGANMAFCTAVP